MCLTLEILNNSSVGAFVGAASAFALVVATDWRRSRRKARKRLPALLKRQSVLASNRRGAAEFSRDDQTRCSASTQPPFSRDTLIRLAEDVPDHLTDRQQEGLDNIALLMREADRLNSWAVALLTRIHESMDSMLTGEASPRLQIPTLKGHLHAAHAEEAIILARLEKLINAYLADRLNEFGSLEESKLDVS